MTNMTAVPMARVSQRERIQVGHTVLTVIGSILCVILIPILFLNCALIWQTHRHPGSVPNFGGAVPLIIQTDVLYPEIQSGDLIVCRSTKPEALREGDIIAFVSARTAEGISVKLDRVAGVVNQNGVPVISVNVEEGEDGESAVREVSAEELVGVYRKRIPGLGSFALFMKTTQGLILFVFLPILLLISYDVLRARLNENRSRKETDRLAAELSALREAQKA